MFAWQRVEAHGSDVVEPHQRLPWGQTIGLGLQHVVAMFGATFLVPVITGFPPSTTILFSGIGTIIFLLITKNQLPSYLGSSFAFIAPVTAASAPGGALGGIMVVGILLMLIGGVVHFAGTRWIDALMPPIVAGAIVALIGFNLAPEAGKNFQKQPITALITLCAVIVATALFRGMASRMALVIGVAIGYIAAVIRGEVDFSPIAQAAWVGLPTFTTPTLDPRLWLLFLPVVLVLVAENIGHVRGVAQLTGTDLAPMTGRALFADGLATVVSGSAGGSGTTTYGENIGVMAATRVYSTAAYWVAALFAIALGLSPKVGAAINTIPPGVIGGVSTVLYGLIGVIGIRIWVDSKVDFSQAVNQLTAAVALIVAIANFTFSSGGLSFAGIALGSLAALIVYHASTWMSRLGRA